MKVIAFEKQSIAEDAGFRIGDDLVRINGHPVRDEIDLKFHAGGEELEMEVVRDGKKVIFEIEKDHDDSLGAVFEDTIYRSCGNNCIFCFVDQNPAGLRKSLYFKDEDFRLSFLHGNYVTLTNVGRADLRRIVEQRLSPLYISVHSTDPEIRRLMLGLKKDDRLIEKIRFLAENKIELHAQIVLCPSINDGESMVRTIRDLALYYPQLRSIAVVPVGLTKHRQRLYPLQPATPRFAKDLIGKVEELASEFERNIGDSFVYPADEFYLLAGTEFPPAGRYGEFAQIENGVGMARKFIDRFEEQRQYLPRKIKRSRMVTLVSGVLAAPIIERWVIPSLNGVENLTAEVVAVKNVFYGDSVTATGLLTGQDIYKQLGRRSLGDMVVLPANCLNYDGIFLDDWTPEQLQGQLKKPLEIVDDDFLSFLEKLKDKEDSGE